MQRKLVLLIHLCHKQTLSHLPSHVYAVLPVVFWLSGANFKINSVACIHFRRSSSGSSWNVTLSVIGTAAFWQFSSKQNFSVICTCPKRTLSKILSWKALKFTLFSINHLTMPCCVRACVPRTAWMMFLSGITYTSCPLLTSDNASCRDKDTARTPVSHPCALDIKNLSSSSNL